MFKALLLDLDDTLLSCSMETFIPVYFQALTRFVAHLIPADRLMTSLMQGINAIEKSDGIGPTNEEKFLSIFYSGLGHNPDELKAVFEQFYAEEFPKLQHLTKERPEARLLVEWAFENGLDIVIATNPIFPLVAIEQRLAWAKVPVTEFDYALVTALENMHAIKPHPAYYREILER